MGLAVSTENDLLNALFADGFSTAKEVTDLSGRGVGMGVLRSVVQRLGGDLSVRSQPGAGTCISMTFPDASSGTMAIREVAAGSSAGAVEARL
jgi:two-component system chemotaxis sensor kinase CheA